MAIQVPSAIKLPNNWTYPAILYKIIDLGTQENKKFGTTARIFDFTFELPTETKEFDWIMKPLVVSREYAISMNDKANLPKMLYALNGWIEITDEQKKTFDGRDWIGKQCTITVDHNDSWYPIIVSVAPTVKWMAVQTQFNNSIFMDLDMNIQEINDIFVTLPEFIQKKIKSSPEFLAKSDEYIKKIEEFVWENEGQVPF